MKQTTIIIIALLWATVLFAQPSKIENTRLSLSTTADSLIVKYDLTGKYPAFNVKLEVSDSLGKTIPAKTVTGDIGNNIMQGTDKTIIWNMSADKTDVYGSLLYARVTANIAIPAKVKKEVWIPWLYIAAGASAATGVYAHLKANSIYEEYSPSAQTDEAEQYRADVQRYDNISKIAFGAAGGFGIAGVIVHIKHNQKKHAMALSYIPVTDGAVVGLTCNF